MEKMPYQPHLDPIPLAIPALPATSVAADWRSGLPLITGSRVSLRDLRVEDAGALFAMLTTEEVSRFITPPPPTVEAFERFIAWTHRQRAAGKFACFAVVPNGTDTAVGIFQLRSLEKGFGTAEWGFAIGSPFWGTGVFVDGAHLLLDFAFGTVGVHRLEARASTRNGRGNGALMKMGAVQEGVLRRAFCRDGQYDDEVLWAILEDDWTRMKTATTQPRIH